MTERKMLEKVKNREIDDDVVAKATERLKALDDRNAKRKSTPSKSVEENKKVKADIVEYLKDKDFTLGIDIASGMEISKGKVSSLCSAMAKDGVLLETEVSVPKVGKRKAYKIA